MMLEILHHPPFHGVLDEVHNGTDKPTPIREFGGLAPRPKSHKPNAGTRIEVISYGIN